MRLWMLVDPGFLELAAQAERLYARWDRVTNRDWFERPYRWMVTQMAARGLDTGGHPPFWAWHPCGAPGRRIDLRTVWRDGPILRLTLGVPDQLVLLSDFTAWHHVLNDWYLPANEQEHDRADAMEDARTLTQRMKEDTWPRIFYLTQWDDPAWGSPAHERHLQACLPWFERGWIRKTERFEPPTRVKRQARVDDRGTGSADIRA